MGNAPIQATNKLQELLRSWKADAVQNYNRQFTHNVELQILEELFKVGADLNYLEQERGFASIPHVFWSKELIEFFVDRGANVNSRDENGDTALHLAIRHGEYEIGYQRGHASNLVHCLVNEFNADPNVTNVRGETPLFSLAKCIGTNVSFPSSHSDDDSVHPHKQEDLEEIPKTLMDRGADVTICNGDDESVLHKCIYSINSRFIQQFEVGNVDVRTSTWLYSKTPLMVAAIKTFSVGSYSYRRSSEKDEGYIRNCRLMLERGADINATDLQGYTALHHAVLNGASKCAKFLIEKGADPNVKSSSGRDPYDLNICRESFWGERAFTLGSTPRKQIGIMEIGGTMMITRFMDRSKVINLWDQAMDICKKFDLQPTQEFLDNYEFFTRENLNYPNEEIRLSAMNRVAILSEGTAKFWNFLPIISVYRNNAFIILNFLSEELKRVEDFASLEEVDLNSLSKLVEDWIQDWIIYSEGGSKNEALTPDRISHVHSIARLVIACFNKLTHVTNSNKVTKTCTNLYVRLCLVLTSFHSNFADVMTETDFSENKRLLKNLIKLDLRDGDSNSLLHLVLRKYAFLTDLVSTLLDDVFELNVKTKNRMGIEPIQWTKGKKKMKEPFLNVLIKMADRGAHVDARKVRSDDGESWSNNSRLVEPTLREVFEREGRSDLAFHYDSLQCACARVLVGSLVSYRNRVPKDIVDFIRMH